MRWTNLIALFRIAILPVMIWLIYYETKISYIWAIFLFFMALGSDFLQGYLMIGGEKKVGSFFDPFADKILIMGVLFVFFLRGSFSLWLWVLFILRDVIIMIFRWLASVEDIQVLSKWHHKIMTNAELGIVFGLLMQGFFFYKGNLEGNLLRFTNSFISLVTTLAVLLAVVYTTYFIVTYLEGVSKRRKLGKAVKKEKLIVLVNKKARGYKTEYRRKLLRTFAKRRNAPICLLPSNRKNMFDGCSEKIKDSKQIIIAGGDGSFESALNKKEFYKKSLGFFPLGAGNAFYSYFYKGKRFEYLRSRFGFRETELDVLEVEWEKGKVQTTFLTLGIDAEVMKMGKEDRTKNGFWDYIKASWKTLVHGRSKYNLKCQVDDECYHLNNCPNFNIAKIPYYGFAVRSLVGEVGQSDGKVYGLAVVNTHDKFSSKGARFWGLVLAALNIDKSPLLSLKGKEFFVESDDYFPLQVGGDYLGESKWVKVRVGRKQKVLVI